MIRRGDWLTAWKASDEQLNFILTSLNYSNLYDMSKDQYRPSTMNFWSWLNQETTRASIHVGGLEFSDGLQVYMAMVEDTMRSVKPLLGKFLANILINGWSFQFQWVLEKCRTKFKPLFVFWTVTVAGGTLWLDISSILSVYFINKTHLATNYNSCWQGAFSGKCQTLVLSIRSRNLIIRGDTRSLPGP